MSRTTMALALAGALVAPPYAAAKRPPCPAGRYVVTDAPLVPTAGVTLDVVDFGGATMAITSGCGPVKATARATKRGTRVRARWTSCATVRGRARLVGMLTDQCRTLSARFIAKTAGINRSLVASRSACGDGLWDPAVEQCDGGAGPCGAACDACTCPGSGTTSTTIAAGGTTTSTTPTLPTTSTTTPTLPGPDLAGIDWMSPLSAPSGSKIAVQFSVKNFGTVAATGPWYDYVMISNDYAFGGDAAVAVVQRSSDLAPGAQYTVLVPQAQLPVVPAGTYYLYLQTDGTNAVPETNETNDVGALVQIQITP